MLSNFNAISSSLGALYFERGIHSLVLLQFLAWMLIFSVIFHLE